MNEARVRAMGVKIHAILPILPILAAVEVEEVVFGSRQSKLICSKKRQILLNGLATERGPE